MACPAFDLFCRDEVRELVVPQRSRGIVQQDDAAPHVDGIHDLLGKIISVSSLARHGQLHAAADEFRAVSGQFALPDLLLMLVTLCRANDEERTLAWRPSPEQRENEDAK